MEGISGFFSALARTPLRASSETSLLGGPPGIFSSGTTTQKSPEPMTSTTCGNLAASRVEVRREQKLSLRPSEISRTWENYRLRRCMMFGISLVGVTSGLKTACIFKRKATIMQTLGL